MVGSSFGRLALTVGCAALGLALFITPVDAQTGEVRGRVVGAGDKPIEGARITIVPQDGTGQKFETTSRRNGEFSQSRVPIGAYTITVTKDKLTQTYAIDVKGRLEIELKLGAPADPSKEDAARRTKLQEAFAEGARLSNEGKHDEAIEKFNEVLEEAPQCAECYVNIGAVHAMKEDVPSAEAAYKKAIEINPDSVEAYSGLASLYNSQKRYKEAQAMSAEAAKRGAAAGGGGGAGTLYNQAAIMWNSPDAEAEEIHAVLTKALQADPNHAEAHFLMGNVLVRLGAATGDMDRFGEAATAFETYLKLAPSGPNADKAKESYEQLKSFKK